MLEEESVQLTDEELVVRARHDQRYFGMLIERYQQKLLRYIRRISSVPIEEAEDILQEVFIKTYQQLNNFDESLSFSSWIYRITHNETISTYRKNKSRPQGNSIDVEERVIENIASEWNLTNEIEQRLLKQYFSDIFSQLDIKYRTVLELKYIEDKSYKEISDILKKPEGTVATLLNRAKKKCIQLIEQQPYE